MTAARELRVPGAAILAIAAYAGLFPLASTTSARIGLAAPLVIIPLLWWMFSGATRWIAVLIAGATLRRRSPSRWATPDRTPPYSPPPRDSSSDSLV